jgi:hypothetical protein
MTLYEIEFDSNILYIENVLNEPLNIFYDRWIFILKNIKNNPNSNNNIINNLSHIYINYKYYNCKYPSFIYQKIENYL